MKLGEDSTERGFWACIESDTVPAVYEEDRRVVVLVWSREEGTMGVGTRQR